MVTTLPEPGQIVGSKKNNSIFVTLNRADRHARAVYIEPRPLFALAGETRLKVNLRCATFGRVGKDKSASAR